MIKTIFFDFGGVIIKPPNYKWIKRWKKHLGISDHPEIMEMLENSNGSQLVQDVCLGKIPEDHLWAVMTDKWRINPAVLSQVRRKLLSKRQLNQHILAFMTEVAADFDTAILSNAGDQSRQLMEGTYQLHQIVDEIIISAEEGVIKPDPRIFEIAMARMNAAPETSLLLDDSQENVAAAQAFGMRAVQFIDTQQAIGKMRVALDGKV
ncbi:MAG: HAD family phosphatase [Brevefilum sp.]|nr:HAD family phosphatase [Brevefilum sp.]